ncbi:hypothetical protein A9974_24145 [Achromobacter sp. UMC71]|nr:hypothetical protein [Achromobacter sp. UMC71]
MLAQEEWKPTRPLKWILPAAPGGGSDGLSRLITDRLAKRLGQPVVMDYRPGAGSSIAAENLMQQAADGHAVMFSSTTFNIFPLLNAVRYDPLNDFVQLMLVADVNMVLAQNTRDGVFSSPEELVTWAAANPDKAFVGIPNKGGTGELVINLINLATGSKLQPVIYRGGAPMMTDVLGGQVAMAVETMATFGEFIKAGQVHPIALSGIKRMKNYPDIPTLDETIVPGSDINAWFSMQMHKNSPPNAVARLNKELNEIILEPAIVEEFARAGAEMRGGTSEFAFKTIQTRVEVFKKIIRDANIKVG